MRKSYTKPEILFEDFTVTANIATGCDELCHSAEYVCALEKTYGGMTLNIFTIGTVSNCDTGPAGIFDNLCYHAPEGYNTFSS